MLCASSRINGIAKEANSAKNDVRDMKFSALDGGEGVEHNGITLVEISKIFMAQDAFFFGLLSIWLSIVNDGVTTPINSGCTRRPRSYIRGC